jgi:hypothetical protein
VSCGVGSFGVPRVSLIPMTSLRFPSLESNPNPSSLRIAVSGIRDLPAVLKSRLPIANIDDMTTQQDVPQGNGNISLEETQTSTPRARPVSSSHRHRISLACNSCRSRKTRVGYHRWMKMQFTSGLLNQFNPSVMDCNLFVQHVSR